MDELERKKREIESMKLDRERSLLTGILPTIEFSGKAKDDEQISPQDSIREQIKKRLMEEQLKEKAYIKSMEESRRERAKLPDMPLTEEESDVEKAMEMGGRYPSPEKFIEREPQGQEMYNKISQLKERDPLKFRRLSNLLYKKFKAGDVKF